MRAIDGAEAERDRARGREIVEALLGDAPARGRSRVERAQALADGIVWLRAKLNDARLV